MSEIDGYEELRVIRKLTVPIMTESKEQIHFYVGQKIGTTGGKVTGIEKDTEYRNKYGVERFLIFRNVQGTERLDAVWKEITGFPSIVEYDDGRNTPDIK